jgi:hypothetical protein
MVALVMTVAAGARRAAEAQAPVEIPSLGIRVEFDRFSDQYANVNYLPRIIAVQSDGAGYAADLQPGDQIIAVEGYSLTLERGFGPYYGGVMYAGQYPGIQIAKLIATYAAGRRVTITVQYPVSDAPTAVKKTVRATVQAAGSGAWITTGGPHTLAVRTPLPGREKTAAKELADASVVRSPRRSDQGRAVSVRLTAEDRRRGERHRRVAIRLGVLDPGPAKPLREFDGRRPAAARSRAAGDDR